MCYVTCHGSCVMCNGSCEVGSWVVVCELSIEAHRFFGQWFINLIDRNHSMSRRNYGHGHSLSIRKY